MQLVDCLVGAPADQLYRIAATFGLSPEAGRERLVREVARALRDRARLEAMLADLSPEEWAALKVVFFNGGVDGITVELCHQIVNLLAGRRRSATAKAVESLQDRGLIYVRTRNYRQVFFIPADLLEALSAILNRQLVQRICVLEESVAQAGMPERDLVEDLHRFLAYIYRTEVPLTQQGQIFKRHLRALLELLMTPDSGDEAIVGRYPEPLGLLVGYALDRHLIARQDGQLRTTEDLQRWLAEPFGAKLADLFGYWQDRYYYQDLQTFLSVIRTVGEGWVSIDRLVREVEPLINPSQRGSFLVRLRHHLTTFLAPFGLFALGQVGEGEEAELACRLTPLGSVVLEGGKPEPPEAEGQPLVLQATFELIAPRPVSADVLWTLELMADLSSRTDRTLTYRLSRQSVYRALKTGMTGEQMLGFLEARSATGVPQNVAFDLRAWAAAYGQVYLQAVMLLRCADPVLAQQIKASRRTGRFVLGELTPTDLIVDGRRHRELLEALEADGHMPRPEIEQAEART